MSTRKQRGLKERIYLLSANINEEKRIITLSVKGSSNKIYEISLSDYIVNCKCMDFAIRKKICKHLYFILGKIIKSSQILSKVNTLEDIIINFEEIFSFLRQSLNNHVNGICNENLNYDKGDTCSICFEEFGSENINQCKMTCKNIFHTECINLWLSKNNSCPLCRSVWISDKSSGMEKFTGLVTDSS